MRSPFQPRGIAMVLVLLVIAVATIITFSAAAVSSSNLNLARTDGNSIQARYAAEAGIASALVQLEGNAAWNAGFALTTLPNNSDAQFTVAITNNASGQAAINAPDGVQVPPSTVYLVSKGTCHKVARTTRVLARVSAGSVYQFATYGRNGLIFSSAAQTDSYNSTTGAYGGTNMAANGDIGTEGNIALDSSVAIHGVGAAATTSLNGGSISGGSVAAPKMNLPTVDFTSPASTNQDGNWTLSGVSVDATKNLTGQGSITLNAAGTYYFNSINIDSSSTFKVAAGVNGPVKVYVKNGFTASSGFTITNPSSKPANLQFLVGGNLSLDSNSTMYATFYVPNGNIVVSSGTTIFGSLIAGGTVSIDSNERIHFDVSLKNSNGNPTPAIQSWVRD